MVVLKFIFKKLKHSYREIITAAQDLKSQCHIFPDITRILLHFKTKLLLILKKGKHRQRKKDMTAGKEMCRGLIETDEQIDR